MKFKQFSTLLTRRQKQARLMTKHVSHNLDYLIFNRFNRLASVKRFVFSWLVFWLLLVLLISWQTLALAGYFQVTKPAPGGIFSEGDIGVLNNINPIYATTEADSSLSKLIFSGLLTYNKQNQLIDCLASSYSVNSAGTVYTVILKPNLVWQDGQPLTSADVVFTIKTIQNPNAQSPLYSDWQNIKVNAPNPLTVTFTLPNPLASFPYNLTLGIIPKHILSSTPAYLLRQLSFNTVKPIGSGPFQWNGINVSGYTPSSASEKISLLPFKHYVLGKPKIAEFIFSFYANKSSMLHAFYNGQLTAMAGLNSVPSKVESNLNKYQVHNLILTAGDYVFFKTNSGVLADQRVRQALVLASDPQAIINRLGYSTLPVNEPLLIGQLAYNKKYAQITNQLSKAETILNNDGWILSSNGYRYKHNQQLSFNIVTDNDTQNRLVVGQLLDQWKALGVKLIPIFENPTVFSTAIANRSYDSTLDGISIGIDPDVFVYWDKSQFDLRSSNLNLSDYDNANASQALEAGRTRLNPQLRVIKYQPFLADWQTDAPALGLFQPRFIYISNQTIYGLGSYEINSGKDRFNNVQNWEIITTNQTE